LSLLATLTRVQPDGRLFVGERNDGELPTMTIGRVWRRARQAAFMPEVAASPLAKTPLRPSPRGRVHLAQRRRAAHHGGRVGWASVEVLLRIYAKCLDGGDALVRRWVEAALGHVDTHTATDVSPSDEHR
jgi:hypothetical protein